MEFYILYTEASDYHIGKRNYRRVGRGVLCAEHLRAELEKFTAPACLRLFISETIYKIVVLKRHGIGCLAVFHYCAHDRCRTLRAQCKHSALFILEGVHLFLYNVRYLAHPSLEKGEVFKSRCSYFTEAVKFRRVPRRALYSLYKAHLVGENVNGSPRLFYIAHTKSSQFRISIILCNCKSFYIIITTLSPTVNTFRKT